jgi:hypothetical protein
MPQQIGIILVVAEVVGSYPNTHAHIYIYIYICKHNILHTYMYILYNNI